MTILLEHGNLLLHPQEYRPNAMTDDVIDGEFPIDVEEKEIIV